MLRVSGEGGNKSASQRNKATALHTMTCTTTQNKGGEGRLGSEQQRIGPDGEALWPHSLPIPQSASPSETPTSRCPLLEALCPLATTCHFLPNCPLSFLRYLNLCYPSAPGPTDLPKWQPHFTLTQVMYVYHHCPTCTNS